MSELNRYELVHIIFQRAEEKEIKGRNPLKEDDYMPTINKIRERRNFVKESHDEVVKAYKEGKISGDNANPFWDSETKN